MRRAVGVYFLKWEKLRGGFFKAGRSKEKRLKKS